MKSSGKNRFEKLFLTICCLVPTIFFFFFFFFEELKLTFFSHHNSNTELKMSTQSREIISIEEIGPCEGHNHTSTCIMLYGYGTSALLWYEIIQTMSLRMPETRFVIPTAPLNEQGIPMWYVLNEQMPSDGLHLVKQLIETERVRCSNLAIVGFSQGGAVTLASLSMEVPPVAVVCMSSFFKKPKKSNPLSPHHYQTPILLLHGDLDRVATIKSGRNVERKLREFGFRDVLFKSCEKPSRSVSPKAISQTINFLLQHLHGKKKSKL